MNSFKQNTMKKLLLLCLIFSGNLLSAQIMSDTIEAEVETSYKADQNTPTTYHNLPSAVFELKNVGQEPTFMLANQTPSITVYSDAGNSQSYSYIRLRGIDQTRINITLDGVPINEPEDQGAYFSNYPDFFNSISALQIQRGVGVSQNGTASYGGSMQFFSPNLTDSMQASVGVGYGSFNSYRAFGEFQSGVKNNMAIYGRISHVHSDGYKEHSGNNSFSGFLSAGLFLDKHVFYITHMTGQQANQMAWLGVQDSIIDINPRTNANSELERDNFLQSLTFLRHKFFINNKAKLQSAVYYTYLDGNYDFDFNNFIGLPSTTELFNYAFRSHFVGLYSNFEYQTGGLTSTTGIHGNLYNRSHVGSEAALGELYRNIGYKDEFSIFTKANYRWQNFNFFADLQYRYTQFSYEDVGGTSQDLDPISWQFFNPKGGISYHPNKQSSIYYSIGRTGREPTRNDVFGGWDDLGDAGVDSTGSPILGIIDAEYVLDHELGYRMAAQSWKLGANLYYMQFQNEIVLNGQIGPNGLPLNSAFARSFRSGLELQAEWQPMDGLLLRNNSALNYSQIIDEDNNQQFAPILTPWLIISQEVLYQIQDWQFSILARYQGSSYIDFGNTETLDPYLLLNAQVSYQIKGFRISVMGNNLLNTEYFNRGYIDWDGSKKYFVQAPLNYYIALSYHF
jgi:iron complex outermembrane receptor protein